MVSFPTILDNFQFPSESGSGGSLWARFNTSESATYVAVLMGVVFSIVQFGGELSSFVILVAAGATLLRSNIKSLMAWSKRNLRVGLFRGYGCTVSDLALSLSLVAAIPFLLLRTLHAHERAFSALATVHVALFPRLIPTPILSRA